MSTILILGGYGATGKLLAKHLLAQTEHKIIIAGQSLEKARAFVDSLHDPRLTAARVDATVVRISAQAAVPSTTLRPGLGGVFQVNPAPTLCAAQGATT